MSIFVVLSEVDNANLETVIKEKYAEDNYQLSPRQWLISSGETVIQVTENLLITDDEKGPGPSRFHHIKLLWYGGSSYMGMVKSKTGTI